MERRCRFPVPFTGDNPERYTIHSLNNLKTMGKSTVTTIAVVIAVLLTPMLSADVMAENAPLVNVIEFKGLRKIDKDVLREKITQKVGEPLFSGKVSDDVKGIFGMGYFEDVRVEMEMFEGGIKLIYIVKEKPTVVRVEFQGNDKLEDSKLREQITISPGSMSDTVLIQENADKLRAFYESQGYALARVVPVVRKISSERVFLTYQILEGPRVKVKSVKVLGNKAVSSRSIEKVMKTSRWGLFSFMTAGGYYEKAEMDADIERIKDLYYDRGFIKMAVSEPSLKLTEDGKWMDITIRVSEGEQFRISSVGFSGNTVFTGTELEKKIKSAPGAVLGKRLLGADVASLTDMYSEKGYAMVSIYPRIIPDETGKEAKVLFRINEGDVFRVGRIDISGNQKTRDKVIRREMKLNEGDVFNSTFLRKSYRRINNLNLFEQVALKPEPDPATKNIGINIDVKERATGFLSAGGGYSSLDRWIGTVDFTEGNLGGRGQHIRLKGEFSARTVLYELSFRDPWFMNRPVSFTTSVFNTTRTFTDYKKTATGFTIGFGKRFPDYWSANMSYRFEKAAIFEIKDTASNIIKEQEGTTTTSSVSPSVARDTRDNFLDPHRGSRNVLSLTYAGLGGDNRFIRGLLDSIWYVPAGSTTLSFRSRYGYASGLFGRNLPLYERFYVGGIYTVRGFSFGEAGPRGETGDRIGGTKELVFNVEYVVPLISEVRLKGVAFFDAGSAFEGGIRMDDLRYSAGLGVRWISPIGPIRLEWGYNIEPRPGESQSRWDFAFGTFF